LTNKPKYIKEGRTKEMRIILAHTFQAGVPKKLSASL
jgi:hypothetical protein